MRVNIQTEDSSRGWILRRMADELAVLPNVTIGRPDGADVQYYVNYALYQSQHPGRKVALFTHLEEQGSARKRFLDVADICDEAVAMNRRVQELLGRGRVIHIGAEPRFHETTFGVAGRVYPTGRKGEHLVERMADEGLRVVAWGKGWPCETLERSREEFYERIDYFVVTSTNEGGPATVPEAIAARVPVIAPDVGFCWEWPVLRYDVGSWESLRAVLLPLARPRTWEDWRQDHRKLFSELERRWF